MNSPAATAITLEQLIALNDEMAALVRSGVPLERGLREIGADLPGRAGRIARLVAERIEQGEPLVAVFEKHPEAFPPVYRAVVEAGLQSGRLAIALEALAGASRRMLEARRIILLGLLYPLFVLLVAWAMFSLFVTRVAPAFLALAREVNWPGRTFLEIVVGLGAGIRTWGPFVPLGLILAYAVWAALSARAGAMEPRAAGALLGWLPWTHRMLASFRLAMFTDLLALLTENQVPLPKGLRLAGEAVGGRRLCEAAATLAASLERGEPLGAAGVGLPPLLHWLMAAGQDRGALVAALRHAAEIYHRRARQAADAARLFVPVLLTLALGGTVTLLYCLLVFGSWSVLLQTLGRF